MSKIKQVLLMHRNGMSNRAIAKAVELDKCTVNEYIRKIKADPLSLEALLSLEEPELEAHMFAGNPAYTDERMKGFLDKLPYFREQLEDKHVTRLLLGEEYRRENPDGYGKSQFFCDNSCQTSEPGSAETGWSTARHVQTRRNPDD